MTTSEKEQLNIKSLNNANKDGYKRPAEKLASYYMQNQKYMKHIMQELQLLKF